MSYKKVISDEEFMRWAQSEKPCRYCERLFVGPVCPCERKQIPGAIGSQITLALSNKPSKRRV